jgi:hypothetical protein
MKAFTLARERILTKFEEARASSADYPTDAEFPIEAPNRRFKKPASGPWGRLTLQFGERVQVSIGGSLGRKNRRRTPFVLTLQIFVPENAGESVAYDIAEQIMGPLDVVTDGVLTIVPGNSWRVDTIFETSSLIQVGKAAGDDDEGAAGVSQLNASISGHFDDIEL